MSGLDDWKRPNVFFIFNKIAGQLRVTAIDEMTGVEVVVVGAVETKKEHIERIALAKLRRALVREKKSHEIKAEKKKLGSIYGRQIDMSGWDDDPSGHQS